MTPWRAVELAKAQGFLHQLDGSIPCVDCGRPAKVYDHRDYSRPLDVEPVCKGCNKKRGPGLNKRTLGPRCIQMVRWYEEMRQCSGHSYEADGMCWRHTEDYRRKRNGR